MNGVRVGRPDTSGTPLGAFRIIVDTDLVLCCMATYVCMYRSSLQIHCDIADRTTMARKPLVVDTVSSQCPIS